MKYSKYEILEDRIRFDFYEFYFSSLQKNSVLTLDRIKEVDFNTSPCSMEIDDGELIFFNHDDKPRIKEFTEKHEILESKKVDVWNLFCNTFLDTEFKADKIRKDKELLKGLGFSLTEQETIRKRIKWSMFGTWEWGYLGHWDVLAMKQYRNAFYRLNGSDFYWWTMKVALKGSL